MTQPVIPNELATAILAVYRGPLEEFVTRRDALVKQLRATKQRESADRVKALRKPSRMAWVLDSVVHEDPASIERVAAAITEAQTGADLRAALETIKAAVRDVAAVGARVAVRAGQPVEPNAVITAMHAVIGDASAFADLRAGQLVEVPEGGGLDMLAATSARDQPGKPTSPLPPPPGREAAKSDARAETDQRDAELAKAAHADLRRVEASLAEVSERSEHAVQSVLSAQKKFDAAERALLHAQSEAQARRAELERVLSDAEGTAAALQDAEHAVAAARARVAETEG
jgi:hypothetical protein